jgi:hypothetical protein
MSRIRTIKPEFFTSEDIVSLSPMARLLYIACWCEADREGRLKWNPRTLKLRYFPGDNCDIDLLATELVDRGLVLPYDVDAQLYAEIPSFAKHQIINNRESASYLPPRVKVASQRVLGEGRKEGKGSRVVPSIGPPQSPVRSVLPLVDGSSFEVTQEHIDSWKSAYPAIDVAQQIESMRVWLDANPRNQKTPAGIERFIVGWLSKSQNSAGRLKVVETPVWAGAK